MRDLIKSNQVERVVKLLTKDVSAATSDKDILNYINMLLKSEKKEAITEEEYKRYKGQ